MSRGTGASADPLVRYTPFVELLKKDNLAICNSILFSNYDTKKQDDLVVHLVHIFDAFGGIIKIIEEGMSHEVETTKDESTLFRQNTVTTKVLKTYTKIAGENFLKGLTPLLEEIATNGLGYIFYEVDPARIEPGQDIVKNQKNLDEACQMIMDFIFSNVDAVPYSLRYITSHLCQEVVKRFPHAKHIAISGYVFLRWMIPAISVKPEQSGLIPIAMATPKASRVFLLIGMVLQMLANGLEFNIKQPHMVPLNDFINRNMEVRDKYLDDVSTIPDGNQEPAPIGTMEQVLNDDIPALISHIMDPNKQYDNLQKIFKSLKQYNQPGLMAELQECLIATDSTYKKVFNAQVITEISGLKPKKSFFGGGSSSVSKKKDGK